MKVMGKFSKEGTGSINSPYGSSAAVSKREEKVDFVV